MQLAPIVLFVYNRPWHTEQTLIALSENKLAGDSELYIFADGAKEGASQETLKKIEQTREIIKKRKWCKKVYINEANINKGLANSIIDGITEIFQKHDKIIVLEDDLITSTYFLKYMNDSLNNYSDSRNVMQIAGFSFPAQKIRKNHAAFFAPICNSWGWGTWKRVWDTFDVNVKGYEQLKSDNSLQKKFDLDGSYPYTKMLLNQMESKKIDSWAIRFWWFLFKNNGITLFPDRSLIRNIGFGEGGTHTIGEDPFPLIDFDLNYFIDKFPSAPSVNEYYFGKIKRYFQNPSKNSRNNKHPIWDRLLKFFK